MKLDDGWFVGWVAYGLPGADDDGQRPGAAADPGVTGISYGVLRRAEASRRRELEAYFRPASPVGPGFGKRAHWEDWPEEAKSALVFRRIDGGLGDLDGCYVLGIVAGRSEAEPLRTRGRQYNHALWLVVSDPGFGLADAAADALLWDRLSWATSMLVANEQEARVHAGRGCDLVRPMSAAKSGRPSLAAHDAIAPSLPQQFLDFVVSTKSRTWDPAGVFRDVLVMASRATARRILDFQVFARGGYGVMIDPIGGSFASAVPYDSIRIAADWRRSWPAEAPLFADEHALAVREPLLVTTDREMGLSIDGDTTTSTRLSGPIAPGHVAPAGRQDTTEPRRQGPSGRRAAAVQAEETRERAAPPPPRSPRNGHGQAPIGPATTAEQSRQSKAWFTGWRYFGLLCVVALVALVLAWSATRARDSQPARPVASVPKPDLGGAMRLSARVQNLEAQWREASTERHTAGGRLADVERRLQALESRALQPAVVAPPPAPAATTPPVMVDRVNASAGLAETHGPPPPSAPAELRALLTAPKASSQAGLQVFGSRGAVDALALSAQEAGGILTNLDKTAAVAAAYEKLKVTAPPGVVLVLGHDVGSPEHPMTNPSPELGPAAVRRLAQGIPALQQALVRRICITNADAKLVTRVLERTLIFPIASSVSALVDTMPADDCLRISGEELAPRPVSPASKQPVVPPTVDRTKKAKTVPGRSRTSPAPPAASAPGRTNRAPR